MTDKTISHYQLLVDLIPDIIAEVDVNKVYTWMNKSGKEFFGNEVIGKQASDFFADEQDTYTQVDKIFTGEKESVYVESWQNRKDGQKRLLGWWCRGFSDKDGKITGAISTAHDITEHRDIEEKLKYSQAQLYNAMELAHLGPWEYDVPSDKFTFNDTFYKMLKTTAAAAGGYHLSSREYAEKFVYPEDAPLVGQEVQKTIENKDPHFTRTLEHRIIYGDGTVGHILVRFFGVKDESGKTVKTFGINQDITERVNEQKELKKRADELEKINQYMVNRELRMAELKKENEVLRQKISQIS